ncbi:fumarate hydratase, class II [Sarotherodon galilaeus]
MGDLMKFLKQREVSEEIVQTLENEKYLDFADGGAAAASQHFLNGCSTRQEEHSQTTHKRKALKTNRKIEIGWMHYDENTEVFKQVRARRGGGTRKIDICKDANKRDILQSLDNPTVGELHHVTKLNILRFYLTTKKKQNDSHQSSSPGLHPPSEIEKMQTSAPFETIGHDVTYIEDTPNNILPQSSTQSLSANTSHSSDIIFVDPFSDSEPINLDDTLIFFPQPGPSSERVRRVVVVHRGQVMSELISHFSDKDLEDVDIKIQLVLPDGTPEMAYDDGGVVRDCLSEFWKEFYDQCTTGNVHEVHFLRHDFGQQEWESVGRINAFGWVREKYLPVKIAPGILEQAAFGYVKSDIVENFLKFMPESERTVLEAWRSDFSTVDQEGLVDILDNHSCRKIPTAYNATEVLLELAHKTLVQEPAYVIEQWARTLRTAWKSLCDLSSCLTFPETMTAHQKVIQKYLTTYVKNAGKQHLCLFLRFCTGSDLNLGKNIIIGFNKLKGFQRRPVAHTCGCVLELPINYDRYPDFRSEMNSVLESNVWVMDII